MVSVLAIPVVTAELGWMAMGIVDTIMVGWIGPAAIGSVGVGHALFDAIGLFRHRLARRARHAHLAILWSGG